jgi:hypothetical protein
MTEHPQEMTSGKLLFGIEAEVSRCMDLLLRIEEEILPLVSHPIAPTLRAALQDIDLLSQCLDDIKRTVHGAATAQGSGVTVNAESILSVVRLQDMRLRLEGGSYDARKLTNREEMFEPSVSVTMSDQHLF